MLSCAAPTKGSAQLEVVKGGAERAAREHADQCRKLQEQWLESQAQLGQARAALKQERKANDCLNHP